MNHLIEIIEETYKGDKFDGKYHGYGECCYIDGSQYNGEFYNGKRQGQGTLKLSQNSKYIGEFINDLPHGMGKYIYNDGTVYEGEFEDGLKNGFGTMTQIINDIQTVYKGNFLRGVKHGKGMLDGIEINYENGIHIKSNKKVILNDMHIQENKIIHSNGDIYEGDLKSCEGIKILYADGRIYLGSVKHCNYWHNMIKIMPHGFGEMTFPDGRKYIGRFLDGNIYGQGTSYYTNGASYCGMNIHGCISGNGNFVNARGDICEGDFSNLKLMKITYASGLVYTGPVRLIIKTEYDFDYVADNRVQQSLTYNLKNTFLDGIKLGYVTSPNVIGNNTCTVTTGDISGNLCTIINNQQAQNITTQQIKNTNNYELIE